MGKSKRKHVLNAALKALIEVVQTTKAVKFSVKFISELAALPEDKQEELSRLSPEQFEEMLTQSELAAVNAALAVVEIKRVKGIVEKLTERLDVVLGKRVGDIRKGVQIFTAKLPVTGRELFGREKELELLDEAWGAGHTHIVSLVAWGGVGKSALVNEWLNNIEADNWRGAERVYGWSFYSQGTREDRQASGDEFLSHALEWFGDEEPAKGSPWDKGVRLAGLIRQKRTLLVLDGLEPLQYPPGAMEGRLKDKGLQGLLREISRSNNGLCVISTRENVADIENTVDKTSKRVWLENLSDEAGAKVLKSLGIKGTKKELKETSREFKGHALALNLLGSYLATVHDGEIRKKDLVPALTEDEKKGGHAKRVMESYEIWLKGKPELDILNVMGLFDRPAGEGAIKVLREKPEIKGLTEKIVKLSEAKWQYAVRHLRGLRLLAERDKDSERLDCHPLIREHFGAKLKEGNPEAWREAHGRLYEYFRDLPEKDEPDTLEEMEPLFCAVAHGCAAGRHQETLIDVYYPRIQRGGEINYCFNQLGAIGSDLGAVAGFFDECLSKPASGLSDSAKALVLNFAGFRLRAVGRLRETAEPTEASIDRAIKLENWQNAAIGLENLSEIYLALGEVREAVENGREGVEFADRSEESAERRDNRTTLGDALYQAGETGEAEELFNQAEVMEKEGTGYEYLYGVSSFQFCDLLLRQGKYREVKKRAKRALEIVLNGSRNLLDIALNKVSLGQAYLFEALEEETSDFGRARGYLDEAVDGLREAGTQDYLPRGLIARTAFYRHAKEFRDAWRDLEEAREIADRGEMKLHLADCALEAVRLNLAEGKKDDARAELEKAKGLVGQTGYHRRDKEIQELLAVLSDDYIVG